MENMENGAIAKELMGKLIGAEQILFLLTKTHDSEYTETIEIVRSTLAEAMALADVIE